MRKIDVGEGDPSADRVRKSGKVRRVKPKSAVKQASVPFAHPPDVAFWHAKNELGERLGCFGDEGAMIYEWPISELTVDSVRQRWGAGSFVIYLQNSRGEPRGRKNLTIAGDAKDGGKAKAPRVEVLPSQALVPGDPMERAIQLLGALDGFAERKAQATIGAQSAFLQASHQSAVQLFQAAMGQRTAEAKIAQQALPEQLEKVLLSFSQRLSQIEAALAEDGEEDEEEDDEVDRAGVPSLPEEWKGVGDMLYRVLMRQVPALEKALPGLLEGFIQNLQAKAAEAHAAAGANGAAVIDVPGVPA